MAEVKTYWFLHVKGSDFAAVYIVNEYGLKKAADYAFANDNTKKEGYRAIIDEDDYCELYLFSKKLTQDGLDLYNYLRDETDSDISKRYAP